MEHERSDPEPAETREQPGGERDRGYSHDVEEQALRDNQGEHGGRRDRDDEQEERPQDA